MSNKIILIICYSFPPYPGIGGRRWAKFAKFLAQEGYVVHVIGAKNRFNHSSLWAEDVIHENIKIHTLNSPYPLILSSQPSNLYQKFLYKLWEYILKIYSKGAIYDRALFWKKSLPKKASELISKYQIKNIIATGAPFRILYYTVLLKKTFPDLNIISDFRDPWTWETESEYPHLSVRRLLNERQMENHVIVNSDLITAPANIILDYFRKNYTVNSEKIIHLAHGFDDEEVIVEKKINSDKIRMLYYGNLYLSIDSSFQSIADFLVNNNKEKITIDIYSSSNRYKTIFLKNNLTKNVTYYDALPSNQLFKKFKNYDYILIINNDTDIDYISTKFYEIIYSKTPIIYIANNGVVAEFLTKNGLGIHITPEEIEEKFKLLASNSFTFNYNTDFSISEYSYKNLTKELINILK
jgi:hypothetical protein